MRQISIEGFERPKRMPEGPAPMLQWIKIADLLVDPAYQRPIVGRGRTNVARIARSFRWTFFAPVVRVADRRRTFRHHRRSAPDDRGRPVRL